MQNQGRGGGAWGGPGRGGARGGRGGSAQYTPKQTTAATGPSRNHRQPAGTATGGHSASSSWASSISTATTGVSESEVAASSSVEPLTIYTVGYGGLKSTAAFIERLQSNGITRLLDIRISPHCGFNKDLTGRNMGPILRDRGIEYEHFMELGNVWRSEDSESEMDAPTRLRLYRELITLSGELLTRRLRQRVENGQVRKERVCILCACGNVQECHRNIVASYLHDAHHYTVKHI